MKAALLFIAVATLGRKSMFDSVDRFVTVMKAFQPESQGGRGYAYETYASYKFTGPKLKRVQFE